MIVELKVKVYAMKDIDYAQVSEAVGAFVDKALCRDENFAKLHEQKTYMPYVIGSLTPISHEKIYRSDNLYSFFIRTLNMDLAAYLCGNLRKTETEFLKGLIVDIREIRENQVIEKIYSLTPVVLKLGEGKGYWKKEISLEQYEKLIRINLIKKHNYFYSEKMDENFVSWSKVSLLNQKPIAVNYKNGIKLLGDKLELDISENESAQKLARMAIATGVGHNCARGCGFVNYSLLKGGKYII